MSTELISPIPIPEQTIVGSGSYTIPANKYGFLNANVNASAVGWFGQSSIAYNNDFTIGHLTSTGDGNGSRSSSAVSAPVSQYLVEGDTITTQTNLPSTSYAGGSSRVSISNYSDAYTRLLINGTIVAEASVGASSSTYSVNGWYSGIRCNGRVGWSVALYPIPKNNLPDEMKEGN